MEAGGSVFVLKQACRWHPALYRLDNRKLFASRKRAISQSRIPPSREPAVNHAIDKFVPLAFCGLRSVSDPARVVWLRMVRSGPRRCANTEGGLTLNLIRKGIGL
jgi:hypothetical protein